jgi:hypothetical protein
LIRRSLKRYSVSRGVLESEVVGNHPIEYVLKLWLGSMPVGNGSMPCAFAPVLVKQSEPNLKNSGKNSLWVPVVHLNSGRLEFVPHEQIPAQYLDVLFILPPSRPVVWIRMASKDAHTRPSDIRQFCGDFDDSAEEDVGEGYFGDGDGPGVLILAWGSFAEG